MLNIIRSELTLSVIERGSRKELTVPVSFVSDKKHSPLPTEVLDVHHATEALQRTPLGLSDPKRIYLPNEAESRRLIEDLQALGITKPVQERITQNPDAGITSLTGVYHMEPGVRKSFLVAAIGDQSSLHPIKEVVVVIPGVPGQSLANIQFFK